MEHQNFQSNLSQFSINLHPLKLLAPAAVCFFSVIFSYSSLLPFISNFMQFSSFSVDKNYVFLLCNGILVLIAKNSGIKISNSHQDTTTATTSPYGEHNIIKSDGSPQRVVEVSDIMKPATLVAEEKFVMEVKEVQQETIEDKTLVIAGGGDRLQRDGHEIVVIDDEEEVEEEEVIGLLSTEELNKKCDDFIRKMRDEIKFEAQQLIMVRH